MIDFPTVIEVFFEILPVLPEMFAVTIFILFVAVALGSLLAISRNRKVTILAPLATIFVSIVRGVPLLVWLYIVYYSLPMNWPSLIAVILTFSLYQAAFQCENIRGALTSVDPLQIEAAWSIGMSSPQAFRRIILPQAFLVALPNICNGYIGIVKAMSLAFTVAYVDILAQAKLSAALNFRYIESYLAAAIVYWLICILLTILFRKLERRMSKGRPVLPA